MILPVFGHLLPNNAGFNFDKIAKNFNNLYQIESKTINCETPKIELFLLARTKTQKAENRQFMIKCMVFNQWFVKNTDFNVCVQTIEHGTVILEGSS